MSDARAKILGRLRAADREAPLPALDYAPVGPRGWSPQERLARLRARMEAAHAEFLDCRAMEWVAALSSWLRQESAPSLVIAPETAIGAKVLREWPKDGAQLIAYDRRLDSWKNDLFAQAGAGLTGTEGAIAETGSLILKPGAAEPRTLSLVPPIHVALLDSTQLYDTLWQAQREQSWAAAMPTNLLLVSGPSRTADIEQVLAYGVHGPTRLLVVLV